MRAHGLSPNQYLSFLQRLTPSQFAHSIIYIGWLV
jgi:hypothetical protein